MTQGFEFGKRSYSSFDSTGEAGSGHGFAGQNKSPVPFPMFLHQE